MTLLRSLLFNALFFSWSALIQIVSLPVLLLPREATLRVARVWSGVILWLLGVICGLRHEIRASSNLPADPYVIASKHQSAWDTLIFSQFLPSPCYVFKRELLWIPLFGWYVTRSGCIGIDRRGGARAVRDLVRQARRALAQKRQIVIFPEGTRVAPGSRRPYHPGVSALYSQLGVPVVPVAVNSGLYWGRRSLVKKPGRIILEILPPIEPGLSRADFGAELERRLETATRALLSEP